VNRNGDARVPFSYIVDGYTLGSWINTQRVNHANGTLGADRESRLQELLGWTWLPAPTAHYVERHVNAADPRTYAVDGERFVGLPGGRKER
jgi:Helicase associated domain